MLHRRSSELESWEARAPNGSRDSLFPTFYLNQIIVTILQRDTLRYLSHLLSAPVIATPIFLASAALTGAKPLSTIICLVFATAFPIIGIIYFARSQQLDYDLPERSTRTTPFLIAVASYSAGVALLAIIGMPPLLVGLMLAYSINTSVMFSITHFWKISIHAAGVTGPLSFLVFKLGPLWGFLYFLVVPIGLIRLRLKQHTILQISAGAVLSAILTWLQIVFLLPLL